MKKVLQHLKPYTISIVIAMGLIFLQAMANLYLPTLMSDIVNKGVIGQSMDSVWKYGGNMLLFTVGAMICSIISTYIASRVAAGLGKSLRKGIFTKVESFSLNEFNKIQTSSLITRTTNDVTQIQNLTLMMIRMMILAPMLCIGGIIMATSKNLQLSILFAVVIPLLLGAIILLASKIVPLFTQIQKRTDKINQVVREKLTGVRVIRAFGTEQYEGERYDRANKDIYESSIKAAYIMASLMPLVMFIINISTIAIVWFGSHLIGDGILQIGDMMAFMQYAMQVLFSILMVTMLFIMIPRAIVSAKRINEVLEIEPSVKDSGIDMEKCVKPGEIEFKNVTYSYDESPEPVLNNLNFKINKGETVAIIGGTGSGKSTLLNLILRFYDVTSGEIIVGGVTIKDISLKSLRNMVGYVPQKVNLFSGSIADNIRYGKQDATNEELIEASKIAQSYDFISLLDKGFDSEVAQGGTNYSGGQKQRISIARAVVKKPDIYVFDDSFSALDYTTDRNLREALIDNTKGTTLVIVAQRVSTIMNADKIIFLEEGNIIAQGKHHELLESCQAYKELVMSQITEEEAMNSGK
ncbi:MAG: ABC transporter ATP-binding protein [Clostridia bacterium]|nr:ABC transporter ATP-binding protein [Clostridia bacterium]MDD4386593.1 ABC transporter ATP-binding protein [Clostridia bacterium]